MAVYTHVDDKTLATFLAGYDLGQATSFKGIAEGVENSNYFLETEKARLVLTLYEKRANPDDLPYFLELMEHLAKAGIPSPLPVRDNQGKALQTLMNKPACIISFLKGVSVNDANIDHCAALGAMLAEMHKAAADFKEVRQNELSVGGWKYLAEKTLTNADAVQAGLSEEINAELLFLEQNWPTDLPTGTIHADLFPDNILFTDHKITGVIDFYFGCTDILAYDLAVCINAWCFDKNLQFVAERAKRLTEMYDINRNMTGGEITALPILCRGAAMRFLLTRLYDWLNPVKGAVVKPKDPLDYLKRLKFHQNVKDTATYVV